MLAGEGLGLGVKRGGKENMTKTREEGEDDVCQCIHSGLLKELG